MKELKYSAKTQVKQSGTNDKILLFHFCMCQPAPVLHSSEICLVSILFYITLMISGIHRNFVRGGVQQIQLRTEDTENADLGLVAP